MKNHDFILASKSEARAAMLRAAGLSFEARDSQTDEAAIKGALFREGATPEAIARELARAKALTVSQRENRYVIGADQVLDLDGQALDKAASKEEAFERLKRLSGREHVLRTAVAVARRGEIVWEHEAAPRLTMRNLSDEVIETYLAHAGKAVFSSVGAYQVESVGMRLFERIEGDYFAILGMPLLELLGALRALGVIED